MNIEKIYMLRMALCAICNNMEQLKIHICDLNKFCEWYVHPFIHIMD